jgi:dihydrofolate reductase
VADLFADVFISLDGSAHGTKSPPYFGLAGPDLEQWITDEGSAGRLSVLGRKTYETMAGLPVEYRDDSYQAFTKQPTLVFSRTLTHSDWPGVELSAQDAVEEIRRRKHVEGPDLRTSGSLSLVRQFLDAGLIDHLRLMVFPQILDKTGDEPLFEGVGDFALELVDQRVLDGRIVLLDYRPAGAPPYVEQ